MNINNISFELTGRKIQGLSAGKNDGPIVLCLHGWLDNAASFVPLFEHLGDKQVIAIDWPGHGHSSHRSFDAHYHFIDWLDDLLEVFTLNSWHNIDIVAHSMGGMVASAFAAAFPEKVKSLTLIDTIGLLTVPAEQTSKQLRIGLLSRRKGKNKTKSVYPNVDAAVAARVQVSDLNVEQAKLIVERGLSRQGQGYIWRSDSRLRMKSPYRFTMAQAQQVIKDVHCPVQLIHGDKGMEMVQLGLQHFGPLFKSLNCHTLTGGHHVHMEQALTTAQLIKTFTE